MMKKPTVRSKNKGDRSKPKGFAGAIRDMQLQTFNYAGSVRPGKQTPQRIVVDKAIEKPDYHQDGIVSVSCVLTNKPALVL